MYYCILYYLYNHVLLYTVLPLQSCTTVYCITSTIMYYCILYYLYNHVLLYTVLPLQSCTTVYCITSTIMYYCILYYLYNHVILYTVLPFLSRFFILSRLHTINIHNYLLHNNFFHIFTFFLKIEQRTILRRHNAVLQLTHSFVIIC